MKQVCLTLGYQRQSYYKQHKLQSSNEHIKEAIKQLVCNQRKLLPRIGTRKLYKLIKPVMDSEGIKAGRDRLFDVLREKGLLIKPRRQYIQTTNSKHWLRKYPNKIKGITVTKPEEVWVSDITYIKTEEGNCYLSMITDARSRKIMGYNVCDSMSASETIKSLQMAISNRRYPDEKLIHHSDRGLQYCSGEYVSMAESNGITMSMTEQSDPYENALAERMNRTIKEEFCLDKILKTKQHVYDTVKEAVYLYNSYRPHLALNLNTPDFIHKKPLI